MSISSSLAGSAGVAPVAVVARDAAIVGALCATVAALASPGSLGLSVHPHPAWAGVLLLCARHGSRGLGFAVPAVWGALVLTALATGLGNGALSAPTHPADVGVLAACVLVAWVASTHERRAAELLDRATRLERSGADAREVVGQLRSAAVELGARAERASASLAVVREVAGSLDGDDPVAGAHAALDLALARTGARGGAVHHVDRGRLVTVAAQDLPGALPGGRDLTRDRTAIAALAAGRSVRRADVAGTADADSDVAAPILDGSGVILGVIALHGVPADSLRPALIRDLELVASWCAGPLSHGSLSRPPLILANDGPRLLPN